MPGGLAITETSQAACIAPSGPQGRSGRVAIGGRRRSHCHRPDSRSRKASGVGESNLLLKLSKLSQEIVGRVIDTHSQRPAIFEQRAAILGIYKAGICCWTGTGLQERTFGEIGLFDDYYIMPANRPNFGVAVMI